MTIVVTNADGERTSHGARIRVAQPRVLHDVLGVGGAAEHPVGDAKSRGRCAVEQLDPSGHAARCEHVRKPSRIVGYAGGHAELGAAPSRSRAEPASRVMRARYGDEQPRHPHRYGERRRRAASRRDRPRDSRHAHRLVIDDVVDAPAGAASSACTVAARRIVKVDSRQLAIVAADAGSRRRFAISIICHRRWCFGSIEEPVAQDDALDPAGAAGLEHLIPSIACSAAGRVLGRHLLGAGAARAARTNRRGIRAAPAATAASSRLRVPSIAQPVRRLEIARALRAVFRQRGQLMDDVRGLRCDDDCGGARRVQRVGNGRRRSKRSQLDLLRRRARQRGDLVAGRNE